MRLWCIISGANPMVHASSQTCMAARRGRRQMNARALRVVTPVVHNDLTVLSTKQRLTRSYAAISEKMKIL
jgi:hypothetical protein